MTLVKVVLLLSLCGSLHGRTAFSSRDTLEASHHGLLDTFSLSFVGNFNLANTIEGIGKIIEGISKFIDLKIISATVDIVVNRFLPTQYSNQEWGYNDINGPISRIDTNMPGDSAHAIIQEAEESKAVLKEEITTVVGGILDKQQCWPRTACIIGKRAKNLVARDVLFIMAEKLAPSWNDTISLVRLGARGAIDCRQYQCSPDYEN